MRIALAVVFALAACGSREERCARIIDAALVEPSRLDSVRFALEGRSLSSPGDLTPEAFRQHLVARCVTTTVSEICLECVERTGVPDGCPTCPHP
jgi:hypothetical protein